MVITIGDWSFLVDPDATKAYNAEICKDPCHCGYCRNYRATIYEAIPQLQAFLEKFGAQADAPEEIMPFEPTLYGLTFCICGEILQKGSAPILLNGISMQPVLCEELDYNPSCPKPCFALMTSYIELPWVLEEDMNEVVSPANEPEFLQRMWTRLLQDAPQENIS